MTNPRLFQPGRAVNSKCQLRRFGWLPKHRGKLEPYSQPHRSPDPIYTHGETTDREVRCDPALRENPEFRRDISRDPTQELETLRRLKSQLAKKECPGQRRRRCEAPPPPPPGWETPFDRATRTHVAKLVQRLEGSGNSAVVYRSDLHGDPATPILEVYSGDPFARLTSLMVAP